MQLITFRTKHFVVVATVGSGVGAGVGAVGAEVGAANSVKHYNKNIAICNIVHSKQL